MSEMAGFQFDLSVKEEKEMHDNMLSGEINALKIKNIGLMIDNVLTSEVVSGVDISDSQEALKLIHYLKFRYGQIVGDYCRNAEKNNANKANNCASLAVTVAAD